MSGRQGPDAALIGDGTLQARLRVWLVEAILSGKIGPGMRLPSSRAMATLLRVSRSTVSFAYRALADDGYITARSRSGYFVSRSFLSRVDQRAVADAQEIPENKLSARFSLPIAERASLQKTRDWRNQPFPFVYGGIDETLFPIAAWRDCTRRALSKKYFDAWMDDRHDSDDPLLIEQICQKILIRRGIMAHPDEVMVTMGAQNALYLIARLLTRSAVSVALENPGYHDARSIFRNCGASLISVPVDECGMIVDRIGNADLAYVTPSHQFPTNVTMTLQRRLELLSWATAHDALVVEDDYEFETNFTGHETMALKALDRGSRVIYVGSLSKSLMPGIRVGYVVASREMIRAMRYLRRIELRHPPGNNQRTVALYLALGHHDAQIGRLHKVYAERWRVLADALDHHLPGWATRSTFGGSAFWLKGPDWLNSEHLAARALKRGVVIVWGQTYFDEDGAPKNFFRMGFSSIPKERIPEGVQRLAAVVEEMRSEQSPP